MKIKDKKTGKVIDAKLPKAFKTKWLKALRSGKYKQGEGWLFSNDEYCCLGVACRITHPKLNLINKTFMNQEDFGKSLSSLKIPSLLKGSGDSSDDDYSKIIDKLSTMNDCGKSFKQIAAYIEKNL